MPSSFWNFFVFLLGTNKSSFILINVYLCTKQTLNLSGCISKISGQFIFHVSWKLLTFYINSSQKFIYCLFVAIWKSCLSKFMYHVSLSVEQEYVVKYQSEREYLYWTVYILFVPFHHINLISSKLSEPTKPETAPFLLSLSFIINLSSSGSNK